jgi:hypothetical protein
MTQSYVNIGPGQTDIEGFVDRTFYGVKQNRQTGQAYIDKIVAGSDPIRLPDPYTQTSTDYVNWDWTYNTFSWYWGENGRLIMEVL